ncbi:Phosphoglycolate phosphatase [Anatilimnocola aggregata]|uniref:Phosphoglycolate phosphatase n=1 Tax=Anatilimnocola aggregata TaxID=2528021 RepID=A0A517YHJ9_9BACT|nr:HAD family hydrolase [Anatilimnocola aggregata]QDU29675.1 Phosphoglycolate phosphatase [Anatilimnocola aggregata]
MPAIRGVIFDLDGTLVDSRLDFDLMREEMQLPPEMAILEALTKLPPDHAARCKEILDRHEREGAARSQLLPGVADLLHAVKVRQWHQAIVTRNSRPVTEATLRGVGLHFPQVITRDDGPVKPHPWPIEKICREWQVHPAEVVMIGDYRFDIECGRAAGARTVLLTGEVDPHTYENREGADLVLRSLAEPTLLLDWLESL